MKPLLLLLALTLPTGIASASPCHMNVCVGQEVYRVANDNTTRATRVVGVQPGGKFVLFFHDVGVSGGGWELSDLALTRGCHQGVCVGQDVYRVASDNTTRATRVVGIQTNGKFVLLFKDIGATGGGWERNDLAATRGCHRGFCVGQEVYRVASDNTTRAARIAGIQPGGKFVLHFPDLSATGGGWEYFDLAARR